MPFHLPSMSRLVLVSCLAAILSIALLVTPAAAEESDEYAYRYAYVTQASDTRLFFLNIVNPLAPDETPQQFWLPAGSTDKLINTDPSPDGKWIVLSFARRDDDFKTGYFILVDLQHYRSSRIADFYMPPFDYADILLRRAWSPDSKHYGYVTASTAQSDSRYSPPSLWMYDVESHQTNVLFPPEIQTAPQHVEINHPYDLVWSNDSQLLAFLTIHCAYENLYGFPQRCDPSQIQILDIATDRITAERSIDLWPNGEDRRDEVCNLQWSPDDKLIAFEFACSPFATVYRNQYFDEIFTWDIGNNQLEQVTTNTNPLVDIHTIVTATNPPSLAWSIFYELAWKDSQILLVGSNSRVYVDNPKTSHFELKAYDLEGSDSSSIIDRFPDKLVMNPQLDRIAFRATKFASGEAIYITDTLGHILYREPAESPSLWSIDELRWSADGRWLGYTIKEMIPNEYGVEFWYPAKFNLINAEDGQVIQFQPPPATELLDVVGWTIELPEPP